MFFLQIKQIKYFNFSLNNPTFENKACFYWLGNVVLKPIAQPPSPLILSFFISPPQVDAFFSVSAVKLVYKLLFFNVIASGGLYSLIYFTTHSPYYLSLCVGHNSQSTEHMIHITCYAFI